MEALNSAVLFCSTLTSFSRACIIELGECYTHGLNYCPPPHQVFVQGSLVNLPLVPHTHSRAHFKVLLLLMAFTQNEVITAGTTDRTGKEYK